MTYIIVTLCVLNLIFNILVYREMKKLNSNDLFKKKKIIREMSLKLKQ